MVASPCSHPALQHVHVFGPALLLQHCDISLRFLNASASSSGSIAAHRSGSLCCRFRRTVSPSASTTTAATSLPPQSPATCAPRQEAQTGIAATPMAGSPSSMRSCFSASSEMAFLESTLDSVVI